MIITTIILIKANNNNNNGKIMAQKKYQRHSLVGKKMHWEICRSFGMKVSKKWYQQEPETVVENWKSKIWWDVNIISLNKDKKYWQIIDFPVPYDIRVDKKEQEKMEKYQDLARKLKTIWNVNVTVTSVIVEALGATPMEGSWSLRRPVVTELKNLNIIDIANERYPKNNNNDNNNNNNNNNNNSNNNKYANTPLSCDCNLQTKIGWY